VEVDAIRHQPTVLREVTIVADRWKLLFQRQLCDGTRMGESHWRRQNDEAPVALGMETTKCCREIRRLEHSEHSQLKAQCPPYALGFLPSGLRCNQRGLVVGFERQHDSLRERKRLAQQLYSLATQLDILLRQPCDISPGVREGRD